MDPAVADAVGALLSERLAGIPVAMADWAAFGRQVHLAWLAAGGRGPLLSLDRAHVRSADDVRAAARALGDGLLHLGPGVAVVRGLDLPVLHHAGADGGRPTWRDPDYLVASDPTLARARAAIRAHAAEGEVVYVRGPDGSGRASLVRWAMTALAATDCFEVAPDAPAHPPPGGWLLFRDWEELPPDRLGPLRARLARSAGAWRPARPGVRPSHPALSGLIGRDERFCEVLTAALLHAPTRAPVLILGESGTGKEPLARLVHEASGRRGPLVAVDLASRNENLLEDDLFGHVAGAFEGARGAREGAFRRAHDGTLFIDELGNLPVSTQLRLLRTLETGQVQPLGADSSYAVDVRVVAATNADLAGMVQAGSFRRDLYHRLVGVELRLPPLRDRGDDVVLLAEFFAAGAAGLGPDVADVLRAQSWAGNIRELRRLIEVAAVEARGQVIFARHLRIPGRAPLFVTGRADVLESAGALSRREAQALGALCIVVPAPAERGDACLRNAIFAGLGGRPVTPEAIVRLLAWPWWGNFVELDRKLAALRAGSPGPIDVLALASILPQVDDASGRDPLVSLMSPSVRDDGSVGGWRCLHHDDAVVVGRARTRAECDEPRRLWLATLCDSPGFLAFPHLPELGRVHALVTRAGGRLLVRRAPAAALALVAGPLGGLLTEVEGGAALDVGPAGELRVQRGTETLLQLYLFVGEGALAEATPLLRGLLSEQAGETIYGVRAPRVWALSPPEIAELNGIVVDFVRGGGEFAPHLRASLAETASLELRGYLLSSHPTQSCVRLYQSGANDTLRADLRARLAEPGLLRLARRRLPTNLRNVALGEWSGAGEPPTIKLR